MCQSRMPAVVTAGILALMLPGATSGAELFGGPMVGHTTDRSVSVWTRSDTDAEMVLVVSTSPDLSEPRKSAPVTLLEASDWAGVAEVDGLKPATAYFYDVLLDGKGTLGKPPPAFRTFPPEGRPAKVRVLFGGGIRFQVDPKQPIWNVMGERNAIAFISVGDNIYPDNPITDINLLTAVPAAGHKKLMMQNKKGAWKGRGPGYLFHRVYYRIQQTLPTHRRFVRRVPTYAVWDDHDAYHDGTGGARIPMRLRLESIRTFRENFANPYYGGKVPGTWCHFALADLEFFLLDARTYRQKGGHGQRFLGEAEEKWLKDGLARSKASFKFIVCGSPWNNQPKGGTELTEANYYGRFGDTLASFKWHRDELLKWIIEKRVPGVVLLSGDRHRAEVVKVWPRGREEFVLYDLNNCNIASRTMGPAGEIGENGLIHTFSGRCFGLLDIDTLSKPATVTYEIWGTRSKSEPAAKIYTFTLQATDFLPVPRPQ